ncbi:MAG: hypothetical protein LC768_14140 [Acidobacteria bacterium]|nr:hypothetical protein [Acidobacteriota bacterium]MCA1639453.1 hypothetical protein [Acidobacteriota bacterium]
MKIFINTVSRQNRYHNLSGKKILFILSILLIFIAAESRPHFSQEMKYQAKVRAPELKGDKGWLNTDKPLSLAALKGKVVLLDF